MRHPCPVPPFRTKVAVAIPARDEEERIAACLNALDRQTVPPDTVVVLLNNCTDSSERLIRGLDLRYDCHVVVAHLPPRRAGAGPARRLALDHAARRIGAGGVLMTTDADAMVPSTWVERNLAALAAGADAVCGRAVLSAEDAARIPCHLHADDARERQLIALLDMMAWLIDPDPADLPPRHTEASGASIAVRTASWRQAGGIPPIPIGEDRGFIAALHRIDARIRHDPTIEVLVSGRTIGRAAGGMAETIRRRMVAQDEFSDDAVEPAEDAFRRLRLRARLRAAWASGGGDIGGVDAGRGDADLAQDLGLPVARLRRLLGQRFFGAVWQQASRMGPLAVRRRVRFAELSREIADAERILARLAPPDSLAAD
ncbi:glycosyltransferase [Rhodopila sp.]|uniref:glycosyltransferase n=1 Tax=Rhodopila sp. TaxID=2480087 RepID=UPI002C87774B|nr:glycosyltransferase family 2 protein [Rhodopila sp.]HVZ10160.1 glycosyltransferase family 2 protein [Rhodopila sp.]